MSTMRRPIGAKLATALERLANRIEAADGLDTIGEQFSKVVSKVVRPGPVEDALSGTTIGHPVHPALVSVPIGSWTAALLLDASGQSAAAQRLTGFGVLTALPTALTGASDYLTTQGAERRVGLVHAATMDAAVFAHSVSWLLRRRGRALAATVVSAVGVTLVGVGGWLGGHLAYAQGVGVDTTAFQQFPTEWTDVAAASRVHEGKALRVDVEGIPVLLTSLDDRIIAMADRCTHRGAPLDEGDLADGCVTCPWHDSVFDLRDGSVVSGPATRPQPMFEVDVTDGRVRIRRQDVRSLRTNPVGH